MTHAAERHRSTEDSLRVAVVQLESHPAAYISDTTPLEEPFLHKELGLSKLARHGFTVSGLQSSCLQTYLSWHSRRVAAILAFLQSFSPDILVFPEYSIPWQLLPDLQLFSAKCQTAILAGTHTLQTTPQALGVYRALGVEEKNVLTWAKKGPAAVLPILEPQSCKFIVKKAWSPFEYTDIVQQQPTPITLKSITLRTLSPRLRILPAICSEAIRSHNISGKYLLAVVVSYSRPDYFNSFRDRQLSNRHPVVYCNDAAYGGSFIAGLHDDRTDDWLKSTVSAFPPKEEALVVLDLSRSAVAIETGTAAPVRPYALVSLASIVYGDDAPAKAIADALLHARGIQHADTRAASLRDSLATGRTTSLQAIRLRHLASQAEKGIDHDSLWDAVGRDCVVPGEPLRVLEASLAGSCRASLFNALATSAPPNATASLDFVKFLSECDNRAKAGPQGTLAVTETTESRRIAIVDREEEARHLLTFLDNKRLKLGQIVGREQIGKSAVLDKALSLSGISESARRFVTVTPSASAEFIAGELVYGQNNFVSGNALSLADLSKALSDVVHRTRLIIIDSAHHLFRGSDQFRNEELAGLFRQLLATVTASRGQLLTVSRFRLPESLIDPTKTTNLWIRGLEGDREEFGVALLDAQFRNVGVSPADVAPGDKQQIVRFLGGHPAALAQAANNVFLHGSSVVLDQLGKREGFWRAYVDTLIAGLELTDDEHTLLRTLAGFATPVAREVIQQIVAFPLSNVLPKLISFCLIDVESHQRLWLSGLFRVYWDIGALGEDARHALHDKAAEWYTREANRTSDLKMYVEAEYHASRVGKTPELRTGLLDGQVRAARELYDQEDFAGAKGILDGLVTVKPSRDVVRLAALVNARLGYFDAALKQAAEVLAKDPGDTWLVEQIGKSALSQDKAEIARRLVGIAQTAQVVDARVALLEGRILARERQYPLAIAAFERARDLSVRNPWPYFYLGRMYLRLGELEAASDVLEAGQEFYYENRCHNPRAISLIQALLVQSYVFRDELNSAKPLLEVLRQRAPDNPEVVLADAMIRLKEQGVLQAHDAYRELKAAKIRNRDDRCQFHLYYAKFLCGIEAFADACNEFKSAHRADQTNVYVLILWARTLFQMAEKATVEGTWRGSSDGGKGVALECAEVVRKIYGIDRTNQVARSLEEDLHVRFQVKV